MFLLQVMPETPSSHRLGQMFGHAKNTGAYGALRRLQALGRIKVQRGDTTQVKILVRMDDVERRAHGLSWPGDTQACDFCAWCMRNHNQPGSCRKWRE